MSDTWAPDLRGFAPLREISRKAAKLAKPGPTLIAERGLAHLRFISGKNN
jgi:hypothetical protein